MITVEYIKSLLLKKIEGTGIFLVEVIVRQGNIITVYLDKPDGISMDECADINRFLNVNLDRDIEDYELEVSSPGIGVAFKVREQYIKNIGKDVEVTINNGNKLTGKLLSFSDQEIEMEVLSKDEADHKSRKLIPRNIKININTIKATKSIVSFK